MPTSLLLGLSVQDSAQHAHQTRQIRRIAAQSSNDRALKKRRQTTTAHRLNGEGELQLSPAFRPKQIKEINLRPATTQVDCLRYQTSSATDPAYAKSGKILPVQKRKGLRPPVGHT